MVKAVKDHYQKFKKQIVQITQVMANFKKGMMKLFELISEK